MGEDEGARNQDTSHVVTGGCRELVEAPRERAGSEYENEGVAEGRGGGGGESGPNGWCGSGFYFSPGATVCKLGAQWYLSLSLSRIARRCARCRSDGRRTGR